ncbi:MAG: glycoside hydrolase family 2 protein [Pseudomonadota bacterium]
MHIDLLAADVIPDPYLDSNEIAVQWVGACDWLYTLEFDAPEDATATHEIVFHGLDTVATVTLNGAEILTSENMHRTYRVDVTAHLNTGKNRLEVHFLSPTEHHAALLQELEPRPNCYPGPGNLMRKMASNFGWDWGPKLVTAGLWRRVELVSTPRAQLAGVRIDASMDGRDGRLRIWPDIIGESENLTVEVEVDGMSRTFPAGEEIALTVSDPQLWWPSGLGAQPLYPVSVTLWHEESLLDQDTKRVGFRSIRLDTTEDAKGSQFTFIVNGTPCFVRGANWITDDCFPARISRAQLKQRLTQAKDAHMNMIRVWGGGIYESDDFYDLCDELGLMVWQDFLFSCAAYPEEGRLPQEIAAEARDNVARLIHHPALALWNGNNECIWGYQDWGWQDPLAGKTWGAGYYFDLLPGVVQALHPSGNYYPGSPYSGSMDRHANADEHGCRHIWDVWNEVGYSVYLDYQPRFVSEFGWQAPPTRATLAQAVHDTPLTPTSPGILHHQKATDGNLKLARGIDEDFGLQPDFDDWHFASQLVQARAIELGIAHMRSLAPHCMGSIVWQLNDCWPVTSWAAIDGYGRKKPLWYALKRAYAPRCLTISARGAALQVTLINDEPLDARLPVRVRRVRFDGTVLAEQNLWRMLSARNAPGHATLDADITTPADPAQELIVATAGPLQAHYFFAKDKQLALPKAQFTTELLHGDTGELLVAITAQSLIKDLCVFADTLAPDAEVDQMLLTLLPGESTTLALTGIEHDDLATIRNRLLIRCANDLVTADTADDRD